MSALKDIFGQEFTVGCHIVHIGGRTKTAGAKVQEVVKITPKRIGYIDQDSYHGAYENKPTYVSQFDAIVVDKLMIKEEVAE